MATQSYTITKDILRFEGQDSISYWKRFSMLLTLSVVIATMGLLRNSNAVVIAAMLIAPLMAPILGIAAAMIVGRIQRLCFLLMIVFIAAALSVCLSWLLVYISDVPRGIIIPEQVLARTDPGIEDLIVALAAGIAAAYVQINRAEVSLLPGAAIGVALVPPLSAAGVLLYFGELRATYEAVLLFSTNLGAIILSACVVYVFSGALSAILNKGARRTRFSVSVVITIGLLSFIVVQLANATYRRYLETGIEALLVQNIEEWAQPASVEILRVDIDAILLTADVWAIVDLPVEAQYKVSSIADLLPKELQEKSISEVFENTLGVGYDVTVRYQTRITGKGKVGPRPTNGVEN